MAATKASKILNQIWCELNSNSGHTAEYFSALVFFTGDLAYFPFFEVNKINTHLWVKNYQEISKTHPEKEMREELAKGLVNATTHYGSAHEFNKMESCLNELRELHSKHSEKEVREKFAIGLHNVVIVFHYVEYKNLLSLYELKFDLPDDSKRQETIEIIENLLIEETLKIINTEYKKSEEDLKGFIQKIKASLRDETDAVLLMDKVSEKVPLNIQKLIWREFGETER